MPDGMPPAAEEGLDLTIQKIQDLADDATKEDVARLGDVTEEDQRRLDALEDYVEDACTDA